MNGWRLKVKIELKSAYQPEYEETNNLGSQFRSRAAYIFRGEGTRTIEPNYRNCVCLSKLVQEAKSDRFSVVVRQVRSQGGAVSVDYRLMQAS